MSGLKPEIPKDSSNEGLWLDSGKSGEDAALSLNQPITFTRLLVGDANRVYPSMDPKRTALINYQADGRIEVHPYDPKTPGRRQISLHVLGNKNYEAIELLLYAKRGTGDSAVEFPHTYIRLAGFFPVRQVQNGTSQLELLQTVEVSQAANPTIQVSPNLDYVSPAQMKNFFKPKQVQGVVKTEVDGRYFFVANGDAVLPKTDKLKEYDTVYLERGSQSFSVRLLVNDGTKEKVHVTSRKGEVLKGTGVLYTYPGPIKAVWRLTHWEISKRD